MSDFDYDLPADRIAAYPLARRDRSRLLVCDASSGGIEHRVFADLSTLLPDDTLLVVNDTRVVRARIVVKKPSGGRIEFFLLEPTAPSIDPAIALSTTQSTTWRCLIGGARRARATGAITQTLPGGTVLSAEIVGEDEEGFIVTFSWTGALSFSEILEDAGQVPLPPYIKREADATDAQSYQTVYAALEGSVAAPTAGLHFTPELLASLESRGISIARVTLHVGAGTFRQVKSQRAGDHEMHQERISIDEATLATLIEHARRRRDSSGSPFVVVGTTSLRTLESLYWFGVRLMAGECTEEKSDELQVEQWDPYRLEQLRVNLPPADEALAIVDAWRHARGLRRIEGVTRIMIVPGYRTRMCDALITNFHQPASTLILLVGALLGRDLWKRAYDEALVRGYRFLSYGDSSLLVLDPHRFHM